MIVTWPHRKMLQHAGLSGGHWDELGDLLRHFSLDNGYLVSVRRSVFGWEARRES